VAFAPLMFMKGIMGEFIWVLPAVVIASLIASWIECMFILPSHIYELEKKEQTACIRFPLIKRGDFQDV
jgi:multidrug efflux pump subunit AcrB